MRLPSLSLLQETCKTSMPYRLPHENCIFVWCELQLHLFEFQKLKFSHYRRKASQIISILVYSSHGSYYLEYVLISLSILHAHRKWKEESGNCLLFSTFFTFMQKGVKCIFIVRSYQQMFTTQGLAYHKTMSHWEAHAKEGESLMLLWVWP